MSVQFITLSAVIIMIMMAARMNRNNKILRKIALMDKIETYLSKPLTIKKYIKVYGEEFKPYPMKMTSEVNKEVFAKFLKFYERSDYTQPELLRIVFINKIDGYIHNEPKNAYYFITKNDPLPFNTTDEDDVKIINTLMSMKYVELEEYNINGVITLNNRNHFLSELTSISSYKNTIGDKGQTYSDLVFNFGPVVECVRFETFKDSFEYLFNSDTSDIRLIEKIANTSLISEKREEVPCL